MRRSLLIFFCLLALTACAGNADRSPEIGLRGVFDSGWEFRH